MGQRVAQVIRRERGESDVLAEGAGNRRPIVGQGAARFTERIELLAAGLPDTDRQLLARLAAQILAADADRRGIDLRTAAG